LVTEIFRDVEVIKEVQVREDSDKLNDTNIPTDERGHFKIFSSVSSSDDPASVDILTQEFLQRSKVSQIQILLAEIKKHINTTDEAFIKIEYVKKLYAVQLKKLVSA